MQTSGLDQRTNEAILELRRLLAECCRGPYSDDVREFALILRIGGKLQEFDFEGCERVRRNRKEKYITVDLGVPSYRWQGINEHDFRRFLLETVETGLLCCLRRLEEDRTAVARSRLLTDFREVKRKYSRDDSISDTGVAGSK
jgi:hypothetical protein